MWALSSSHGSRLSGEQLATTAEPIRIVSDFPGGNIVVDEIQGDTIRVHQDGRDTPRFWFHWYFEVQGAQGRTLTFAFTKGNVFGSRGPAVSLDGGQSWDWLGQKSVRGDTFQYSYGLDSKKVRFAFAIPYTEKDLNALLDRYAHNPALRKDELTRSRSNRSVELLRAGRIDGRASYRVLLVSRHHACESIASFVLEGVLEAVLADSPAGHWFREQVEFIAVPFMDKDGVEAGDQGKLRYPHDHWLDYEGTSRYSETSALRALFDKPAQAIDIALDLHCPYIRDDKLYFAHGSDPAIVDPTLRFCRLFEQHQSGPLVYRTSSDSLFGTGWNVAATYEGRRSFWQWAQTLPKVKVVSTFEVPYASVGDVSIDPVSARLTGRDLAAAIYYVLSTDQ